MGRPEVGEEATVWVTVTEDMTARLFGREMHPVYGTAWMVLHVEESGRLLVDRHLGAEEDAAGYRIELTHERLAQVGAWRRWATTSPSQRESWPWTSGNA
ncbi:MAG: hypothetical protein M3Q23_02005 [Actinomycetota bacterium]|nr:hypothetical protein [Actinomycetota bacterium]